MYLKVPIVERMLLASRLEMRFNDRFLQEGGEQLMTMAQATVIAAVIGQLPAFVFLAWLFWHNDHHDR